MEQLCVTNSDPHPCNALAAGFAHGTICASRNFQGITAWKLQQCGFGEVGNKKGFKTQEPCREPAGNGAVKSHNTLFTTRQSNRTFVFY